LEENSGILWEETLKKISFESPIRFSFISLKSGMKNSKEFRGRRAGVLALGIMR
jgi:hypothetical protein